jgi:fatty acid desaturase
VPPGPRWVERLHLQFGYHVEHHLFPTVSGRHASSVRDVLSRLYGDRHLTMSHARALRLLYTRPKIHDGHDAFDRSADAPALCRARAEPRVDAPARMTAMGVVA